MVVRNMAKNLVHCMSPVTIGLKLDPTYPTRNGTTTNPNHGAYRTNASAKTLKSGDVVRFGSIFGVVEVDHQDKLAGADSEPVINFGLNAWKVKVFATETHATGTPGGAELWYYEGATDARSIILFMGKPTAANHDEGNLEHANLVVGTGALYRIGTVLEAVPGAIARDASVEVSALIGGGNSYTKSEVA